ncbi:MAG: hypothetical protein EOP04_03105 [Proteobacteria bacterium]|nr:MAG: hypothetical protein EOP04_03105 [Pseudomonadota bacterium]
MKLQFLGYLVVLAFLGVGSANAGFQRCASENERCSFEGQHAVIYMANGLNPRDNGNAPQAIRNGDNGIDCNNSTFGDPVPGAGKSCWVNSDGNVGPQAPGPDLSQSDACAEVGNILKNPNSHPSSIDNKYLGIYFTGRMRACGGF